MEEIPAPLYGSLLPQTEVEPLEVFSIFEQAVLQSFSVTEEFYLWHQIKNFDALPDLPNLYDPAVYSGARFFPHPSDHAGQ